MLAVAGCGADVVEMGEGDPASGFQDATLPVPTTLAPETSVAEGALTVPDPSNPSPYDLGACVAWDQADAEPVFEVVTCDGPHLVEVTEVLLFEEGIEVAFPTLDDLRFITTEYCEDAAQLYLSGEVSDGLEAGAIPPTRAEWDDGERWFACTLGKARTDGGRPAYSGRLGEPPG